MKVYVASSWRNTIHRPRDHHHEAQRRPRAELMYRMCDYVETSLGGVRRALSKERHAPRWQADMAGHQGSYRYPSCREYHHRECVTCGGCWRHGACTCSPSLPGLAKIHTNATYGKNPPSWGFDAANPDRRVPKIGS